MDKKGRNVGTTMMILQQQYNHQKRLSQIYHKQHTNPYLNTPISRSINVSNRKKQKLKQYETQQHLKNIKKLVQTITKQKTMRDRNKDINDFFAYPALFFREIVKPPTRKPNKGKERCNTKNSQYASLPHSQDSPRVSMQKIRKCLPNLSSFGEEDFQLWADGVNKLIISYNVMDKEGLIELSQKILSLLPKNCTQQFREAAQRQLFDICNSMQ